MTTETTTKDKLLNELPYFTGSEQWFAHWADRRKLYTEGVNFLADTAGAHWLIDEIVLRQRFSKVRAEEFQVWHLRVTGNTAKLTCEDGNKNVVHTKNIEFTDFPLDKITLYFTNNTVLLPSEY